MKYFALIFSCVLLISCNQQSQNNNEIRVGTIAGPETELMEVAAKEAEKNDQLKIEIVEFTDYVMPNQALSEGSLDANLFQHLPYLEQSISAKGLDLVAIGRTFVYPMGIYSKKWKSLDQIPDHALVAIPNDPSNSARALLILQDAKLITLKKGKTVDATLADIESNPKQLQFKEIDAAQLTRVLPDVDLALINTNYSMLADLLPNRDALFVESPNSPYANILVIRAKDLSEPKFKKLLAALHSQAVLDKAQELFKGQAIPAWKESHQ